MTLRPPGPLERGLFLCLDLSTLYPLIHISTPWPTPSPPSAEIELIWISGHTYIWTGGRSLDLGGDLEPGREGEGGKRGGKKKSPHSGGCKARE